MSHRPAAAFTLVEIMIVVVLIGLLASMAIPAFRKIQSRSHYTAVLNNLRQLSSAANQYFLENGYSAVASSDLVGTESSQYIKKIDRVVGENYDAIIYDGQGVSASGGTGTQSYAISYTN